MSTWNLENLDDITRIFMGQEFESDYKDNTLYRSLVLNEYGDREYPAIIREALINGTPDSLTARLAPNFFKNYQSDGKQVNKAEAAERLEGQFNLFYIRGLCLRAINEGIVNLEIYRAKNSLKHRSNSDARIGETINASELLADLRAHKNSTPSLGIPSGPNSGLSVRLPL